MAERGELHPAMEIRDTNDGEWRPITRVKGITFSEVAMPAMQAEIVRQDHRLTQRPPEPPVIPVPAAPKADPEIDCPFCGETIKAKAKKCRHCGEILDVVLRAAQASAGQSVVTNVNVVQNAGEYYGRRWSPAVAILLSFIFPGLGQIYKGQVVNGIVWMIVVILGYALLIVPGLVLHLCCIIGAGMGDPHR
jgi:TM2 domain-containing membrane protein YozV